MSMVRHQRVHAEEKTVHPIAERGPRFVRPLRQGGAIGRNEMMQAVAAVADCLREMGIASGAPAI